MECDQQRFFRRINGYDLFLHMICKNYEFLHQVEEFCNLLIGDRFDVRLRVFLRISIEWKCMNRYVNGAGSISIKYCKLLSIVIIIIIS